MVIKILKGQFLQKKLEKNYYLRPVFPTIFPFLMTMMRSSYVCISGGDKSFTYTEW